MKKIAIIGYGGQGGWHANHALKSDVVSLAGIYDIDNSRIEKAKSLGIHTYNSAREIYNDKRVEIVVVATPNDSHKAYVINSLLAGKNVICEKPVEMSVKAYDEMLEASKKSGKLLVVHQNRRWDVDFLAIREIINSGKIGNAVNIESRIHGSRGIPSDWRCRRAQGGGMIYDWGVHLIDQMLCLVPENIKKVYCEITHITTDEVDDGFRLHITFESGKTALIEVGTYNFIAMPRFYLQCQKGSAIIEDWTKNARVANLKAWNEKDVLPVQTAAGITKTMAPRDEITLDTYEWTRPVSDVHDFYRNVAGAIDGKCELIVKPEETRRVLCVMEAAFKSAESGNVVTF